MTSAVKWTSVPGPETIVRHEMGNGLICQVYENFASPSVVVDVRLRAGSLSVPRERAGLAGFVADMLMRGTESRDFETINETIESVGASLGFDADWMATGAGGRCLSEDLALFMDVLADCILHPTFPQEHITKVRGEILTSLEQRLDDTRRMATLRFYETLYEGHPLGISGLGYEDSIAAIERADLWAFYRDWYRPEGVIVTIVGAIRAQDAIGQVERTLGAWGSEGACKELVLPVPSRPTSPVRSEVDVPGKTQADLVLGFVGLTRRNPDYVAARVANTVLGVFGMMGRIGERVREQLGLAYYAYSTLVSGLAPGPWMAIAGVDPANLDPAVESILDEIVRLREELVTEQELEQTKSYRIGSMPLALETNSGIAGTLQAMEVFDLGLDYLERYPSLIASITAEDVRRVARTYLDPNSYVLAVAKPGG